MSDPEFVYATHITMVKDKPGEPGVGIEDALTPACDFCLDTRCRWSYDCEDFSLPEIGFASTLGWLACDRCSELIEAEDVEGLANRSIKSWNNRMGEPDAWHVTMIQTIQQGYWDHRRGSREAYG